MQSFLFLLALSVGKAQRREISTYNSVVRRKDFISDKIQEYR